MSWIAIVFSIIELIFVSIVISIDNAVLIGTLTKDLPGKKRKITNFIGAFLGLILRLILVGVFYYILNIGGTDSVPFIYIFGGSLIIFAGIVITNPKNNNKKQKTLDAGASALKIIFIIFSVDALLSLDNSIVIADKSNDLADGVNWWEIVVMVMTTVISFPVILYGAKFLGHILNKYSWIIYLSAVLLVSIGIDMFLEDPLLNIQIDAWIIDVIKYSGGLVIVALKWLFYDRKK